MKRFALTIPRVLAAVLFTCLLNACQSDVSFESGRGGETSDQSVDSGKSPLADVDLSGRWGLRALLGGSTSVVITGMAVSLGLEIEVLILMDMKEQDGQYEASYTVCDLALNTQSDRGIRIENTLSDAFIESVKPFGSTWYVRDGALYSEPMIAFFGMVSPNDAPDLYVDPLTDPLPKPKEKDTDKRIIDQDNDGNIGMTIHIDVSIPGLGSQKADLFVVMRQKLTMNGVLESSDRGTGAIAWSMDMSTLDVGQKGTIFDVVSPKIKPSDDPEASRFEMARVSETLSCAGLAELKGSLFSL